MNDITALAQRMKQRAKSAKEFGEQSLYVEANNVLALVEALEKAQHNAAVDWEAAASLNVENQELKQRIAELESRTFTVKLYDDFQLCHYGTTDDYAKGYIDCQNNFTKWLTAAGIQVIEGEQKNG